MGLRDHAHELADATGDVLDAGDVPLVLRGDCSILLGELLALRRFADGGPTAAVHRRARRLCQPEAEPNCETASMDLALATVRGPAIVADLEGHGLLVSDDEVGHLARRDAEEAAAAGSRCIKDTGTSVIDLAALHRWGAYPAAHDAL